MHEDSLKQTLTNKDHTIKAEKVEPTLEPIKPLCHFDLFCIEDAICGRPHGLCQSWTDNQAEITCSDCRVIVRNKWIYGDESVSYWHISRPTWDRDYLLEEDF